MFIRFLPKNVNFYELFEKQVEYVIKASDYFSKWVSTGTITKESVQIIKDLEHEGDGVVHAIVAQLNNSFITPFDREDIHHLAKELDDVIDMIKIIVCRMDLYKLTGVNKYLVEFSAIIDPSVRAVGSIIKGLRNLRQNVKSIAELCKEVNRLENVADVLRDEALATLFETEKDPIAVIKWKEIYQDSEKVLDVCEDIAHLVESIIVKQA